VVVGGGPPPLTAAIGTNAECTEGFGVNTCTADAGDVVQLTAVAPGATTHSWSFGDGATATGAATSHSWNQPGNYTVVLTVGNGQTTASAARAFIITGPPVPQTKTSVVPWIAQSNKALTQSSDLYIHNPGTAAMDVIIEFRKRGLPEANPPRVVRSIPANGTFFVADALTRLFARGNNSGMAVVTVEHGNVEPVLTSFNMTHALDGKRFGQSVPGASLSGGTSQLTLQTQHLVGLNSNAERQAYFGVSNPHDGQALIDMRVFDNAGRLIGHVDNYLLGRYSQRQFQGAQLEELFGIGAEDDYRVEIESRSGVGVLPYGANLRRASGDPSFVGSRTSSANKMFVVGAVGQRGVANTVWQTDLLLANVGDQVATGEIVFTNVGVASRSTAPVDFVLPPGSSQRLDDVLADRWNLRTATGVLTITRTSQSGAPLLVQAESYDNSNPSKRFGQTMPAVSEADAATAGKGQYLVGLRQSAESRTVFWLFNPGTETAVADVVYRNLDGVALATVSNVRLGAGKARQFSPSQHPVGINGAFTIQVLVKGGKMLSAAQVVDNSSNDPAYIQGELR
jgi:hypothetical protein